MKKTEMLKKNNEFKHVFQKGKYYTGNYIETFILKNSLNKNKLGLAISKKVGKSTTRNHIKRLIKENYRLSEEKIKEGFTLVFLWKKSIPIEFANFKNVKEDINLILEKADLLK